MEGPFQHLVPENEGWLLAFFPGGALCVTGKKETAETDTVVRLAFEEFAHLNPDTEISHLVLVLYVHQRRCRCLSVTLDGTPPAITREGLISLFRGAGHTCLRISVASDHRLSVHQTSHRADPESFFAMALTTSLLRGIGKTLAPIDSTGTIRLADGHGPEAPAAHNPEKDGTA